MIVILQRQPLAGVYHDAFDDMPITNIEHMPCAPRALIILANLVKAPGFQRNPLAKKSIDRRPKFICGISPAAPAKQDFFAMPTKSLFARFNRTCFGSTMSQVT